MREYLKVDAEHPNMGLNNKICKEPAYWCKSKQVWLSEHDAETKQCKNKPDLHMIGTEVCRNLVKLDRETKERLQHDNNREHR